MAILADERAAWPVFADLSSDPGSGDLGGSGGHLGRCQQSCCGYNFYGQLGDGTTTHRNTPVEVSGLDDAVAVSAGGYHTCALREGGQVSCWGYNFYGQLGDSTTTHRYTPVEVSDLADAIAVSAGFNHTCALREGGQVSCWGYNEFGQLGDGTGVVRNTPVDVAWPPEQD